MQSFDPNSFARRQQQRKKAEEGSSQTEGEEVSLRTLKVAWEAALDSTHWIEGIRQLLTTTSEVISLVQRGDPV
jgi:hypothetical protein